MKIKIPIPIIDVKKCGGKQVAVVDGKIVAMADSLEKVIEKAKKELPLSHLTR